MWLEEFQILINSTENEHLEFKEAKVDFDRNRLVKYCAAIANEKGGKLILGVTDKHPRVVVGCPAFKNTEDIKRVLLDTLHLRIDVEALAHPDGRVLIFNIPSRPIGMPIQYEGAYWMRSGDCLVAMTPDRLKRIFAEAGPDFSAEICPQANLNDLNPAAIEKFREMWIQKSGNTNLRGFSSEQFLSDAELLIDGKVTYAALILLGTYQSLGKYLGCSEIIFEYRSNEPSLSVQQRKEYREGFFLYYDDLWNTINLRNEVQQYQDGFFVRDIPTFNETVVREAVLNAISHRDYRLQGSVFIKQYPRKLEIISPGGLPDGVTEDNILWRQSPRNRRIAEVFSRCGLVERSGQGMDRMYSECIRESKSTPNFTDTDAYQVSLTLQGDVQDPRFLRFLDQIGKQKLSSFSTEDFIVIDLIHKEKKIPEQFKERLHRLLEQEVIERIGRAKGVKYILSRKFYKFLEQKGVYTRKKGLDRETNKKLLLKHIQDNKKEGSTLKELTQVLPALDYIQMRNIIQEMKKEGLIYHKGRTRGARWYPQD